MKNKWRPHNEPVQSGVWLILDKKIGIERAAVIVGEGGGRYSEYWDVYWWRTAEGRAREFWGAGRPLGRPDEVISSNDLEHKRIRDITGEYLLDEEGVDQLAIQDPRLPEIILALRPDLAVGRALIDALIKSDDRKRREWGIKLAPRMLRTSRMERDGALRENSERKNVRSER